MQDAEVKKQSPVAVLGSQTIRKVILHSSSRFISFTNLFSFLFLIRNDCFTHQVSIGDGDSSSVSEVSEGVA